MRDMTPKKNDREKAATAAMLIFNWIQAQALGESKGTL
jgi:hypothetical protein